MDSAKLILTGEVSPPLPLARLNENPLSGKITEWEPANTEGGSKGAKAQAAKAFEAVFINKLLDAMSNTIGEWGLERDGVSRQIHGMFSLYLAQHIADNGGFGLWREIYHSLTDSGGSKATAETETLG